MISLSLMGVDPAVAFFNSLEVGEGCRDSGGVSD
jgi:hypothetical protein